MSIALFLMVWFFLFLPVPLLVGAWMESKRPKIALLILSLSALLLLVIAAGGRPVETMVMGPPHSKQLYIAMGLNLLAAISVGAFLIIRRNWAAIIAAALSIGWLYMWAMSSLYWL